MFNCSVSEESQHATFIIGTPQEITLNSIVWQGAAAKLKMGAFPTESAIRPVTLLLVFVCLLIGTLVLLQRILPRGLPRRCLHVMAGVGNLCHLAVLPQTSCAALISAISPVAFGVLLYIFSSTSLLRSVSASLDQKNIAKRHAMLEYGICSGVANFLYAKNRSLGRICVAGLICLVFGDGLSSLAAFLPSRWRQYRAPDPDKTLAGIVIGCSGAIAGLHFSQNILGLDLGLTIAQMITLAISGGIIEALYISGEWDNTVIFVSVSTLRYCVIDDSYFKFAIAWIIILMGELCAAKHYLTIHGARTGILVFFVHALAGYEFLAPISLFVIGSFYTSKVFKHRIALLIDDLFTRNACQVLANSYVGLICSLLSQIYTRKIRKPLLFLAYVNYAEAFSDTLASEVGSGLAKPGSKVFVLGKFKLAPPGTDGGMSLCGTIASIVGAGAIAYLWCLQGERRFPDALFIFSLGLQGSLVDSLLGSLFQESCITHDGRLGRHKDSFRAVSLKNGRLRLSNTVVNVLSVLSSSLLGLILILQGLIV